MVNTAQFFLVSAGMTKMWYSDGAQPRQLWFEVRTNVVDMKAYSRSSQQGRRANKVLLFSSPYTSSRLTFRLIRPTSYFPLEALVLSL